jgi:hypothetical protein
VESIIVPDASLSKYKSAYPAYASKIVGENGTGGGTSGGTSGGGTSSEEEVNINGLIIKNNRVIKYIGDAKDVVVPNTVIEIEKGAFADCVGLESLTLPFIGRNSNTNHDMTYIGYIFGADRAFDNNKFVPSSLKTVTITRTTILPKNAIYLCSNITTVNLPNNLESIAKGAFQQCSGLTRVTLPDGLKEIDDDAFLLCENLTSINIPASVTFIGSGAFSCGNLASITVDGDNETFYSENNCIITKDDKTLIAGTYNSVIPSDVLAIGSEAFIYSRKLKFS